MNQQVESTLYTLNKWTGGLLVALIIGSVATASAVILVLGDLRTEVAVIKVKVVDIKTQMNNPKATLPGAVSLIQYNAERREILGLISVNKADIAILLGRGG